tara:strand:- start:139 stop:306 length:168 start_codon:yes stop_codon:yes gene_type:complete
LALALKLRAALLALCPQTSKAGGIPLVLRLSQHFLCWSILTTARGQQMFRLYQAA